MRGLLASSARKLSEVSRDFLALNLLKAVHVKFI